MSETAGGSAVEESAHCEANQIRSYLHLASFHALYQFLSEGEDDLHQTRCINEDIQSMIDERREARSSDLITEASPTKLSADLQFFSAFSGVATQQRKFA
jgi:hypothetical protein